MAGNVLPKIFRALDAISGVAEVSRRFRDPGDSVASVAPPGSGALGQIETRLAGVVVAALKEAFDRDRARLDLERAHLDAERQRAEELLRLELARQAGDRALWQIRLVAGVAVLVWMTSAVLMVVLPGMRALPAKALLGCGWMVLLATLALTFVVQAVVSRLLSAHEAPALDAISGASALPWLLVCGLGLTAAGLIVGLG